MSIRRERFKRLWPKRLEKAIWHIQSIGKLSEKTNYIYESGEIGIISSQLNKTLAEAISKFDVGELNDIDEQSPGVSVKEFKALLQRVIKTEKENKLLNGQINNVVRANDDLCKEIESLKNLLSVTSDRLSREISHVKSSGRLAIPKT
jgi:uncharacterized protein (UPF0335 family)